MLGNVSWGEFAAFIAIMLVIYYAFIAIRYFKGDLKTYLKSKLQKNGQQDLHVAGSSLHKAVNEDAFDELEAVVNDLRYAIFEKAGRTVAKQELLNQLKDRLYNYEGLHKPAYRVAINNYILTNAKDICGVEFTPAELDKAWDS
jgi:hypothetical protein